MKRTDRGTMVRERALTTGFCLEWWYGVGCLQKSEAAGKGCKGDDVLKSRWGPYKRNDVKAKPRQLVFYPLLNR